MKFRICSHDVEVYIRGYADDLEILEDYWEEQIKQFICDGYIQGEFAILDSKGFEDYLCWSIT